MKILVAFVGGAVLAGFLAFVLARRTPPEPLPLAPVAQPAAAPAPAPEPVETAPASKPTVARHKPAAPAPAVAKREEPAKPVEPAPAPAPVVSQPAPEPTPVPVHRAPEKEKVAILRPDPEPVRAEPRQPHIVTIPNGTLLHTRIGQTVSSKTSRSGDTFTATLDQPLVIDDFVLAERGARLEGRVAFVDQGGRVKGVSQLSVELTRITTSDGQRVAINTTYFEKQGPTSKGKDAAKVGAMAGIGAAIGAIAGGGKGAAVGAGAGGAAGAGDVLLTHGEPAVIPVETRITFRLSEPVTVTEKLR